MDLSVHVPSIDAPMATFLPRRRRPAAQREPSRPPRPRPGLRTTWSCEQHSLLLILVIVSLDWSVHFLGLPDLRPLGKEKVVLPGDALPPSGGRCVITNWGNLLIYGQTGEWRRTPTRPNDPTTQRPHDLTTHDPRPTTHDLDPRPTTPPHQRSCGFRCSIGRLSRCRTLARASRRRTHAYTQRWKQCQAHPPACH